jgi:hypothetical protein
MLFAIAFASDINVEKMADAIYRSEGGAKARVPYGILSVKVKDEADARRICINSIRNNIKRWEKAGRPGNFVDFMADRWCPPISDPVGNTNWKRNVKAIYNSTKK